MGATSGDCGCGCEGIAAFPANPATALNYHFGMLLGVEDLKAEQAFHTGRLQRHQRELHGQGVVRGLKVTFDDATGILRVSPGFAVDQLGREIEIVSPQCMDLSAYIDENRTRLAALEDVDKGVDLDLVVSAGACLERPVQAIARECNGSDADVAYSRLTERPQLDLVAASAKEEAPAPDPLGDLYKKIADGVFTPDPHSPEQQALALLAAQAAQAGATPETRAAFTRQAALVASLEADPPAPAVVLEDVHLTLARLEGVKYPAKSKTPAHIDNIRCDVRRLLLPQSYLQIRSDPPPPAAVIGPVVTGATRNGLEIDITFSRAVAPAALVESAFQLLDLTSAAMTAPSFNMQATGPAAAPTGAKLTLAATPKGTLRLVVFGTGATPIVDSAFIALGQTPGEDGRNFVVTL